MKKVSWIYLFLSFSMLVAAHFYYPKWEKVGTEATLSWDVSGYYMYLPAAFIYKDLKECKFQDEVLKTYTPTYDFQQAFLHEPSGHYVMKYPVGQAIQMAPFFAIGHLWASNSDLYEADGFSYPYQISIGLSSLLIALLGLIFAFKILNVYFDEHISGITILTMVIGSNYLEYAGITGSMTHNNLFTINAIIIWLTMRFYKDYRWWQAIAIGLLVGLAALTRPTEILIAIIPILWGVNPFHKSAWREKLNTWKPHWNKLIAAALLTIMVGFVQLIYWKYVSGEWIVYSYEDQGFSWLSPHFKKGLFSYRAGWLMYAPFMVFSLIGFYHLYRSHRSIFWALLIYVLMMMYVTFAWDIWWYGGSLGQRALVQAYPALLFPLAAYWKKFLKMAWSWKLVLGFLMVTFIYINVWWTIQAHRGGMFRASEMTGPYYWKVLGRWEYDKEYEKLLDASELYEGKAADFRPIYNQSDTDLSTWILNPDHPYAPLITLPRAELASASWIRVTGNYLMPEKEWDIWKMPHLYVKFMQGDEIVKQEYFRIARLLNSGVKEALHFDVSIPHADYDRVEIVHWNGGGSKATEVDDVVVSIE